MKLFSFEYDVVDASVYCFSHIVIFFSMHVSMEYGGITLYFCMYPNGLLLLINKK